MYDVAVRTDCQNGATFTAIPNEIPVKYPDNYPESFEPLQNLF
jgi:hypothetical protein